MRTHKPLLGELPDWTRFPRPVGLWLFNEGAGNVVQDLSGNGNTGIINDSVNTIWTKGAFGSTLDFNGNAGERINTAKVLSGATNITFTCWIRPNKGGADYSSLIRHFNGYGASRILLYNDERIRTQVYFGGAKTDLASNTVLANGSLYFVVYTYDGAFERIYINGVLDNLRAETGVLDSGVNNTIFGEAFNNGWPMQGIFDTPMICNCALSASEIAQLNQYPFPWFVEDEVSHLYLPGGPPSVKPYWYYNQMTSIMRRTG